MRSIPAIVLSLAPAFVLAGCSSAPELVAPVEVSMFAVATDGIDAMKLAIRSVDFHVVPLAQSKDADPNDTSIDDDENWYSQAVNVNFDPIAQSGPDKVFKVGLTNLPEGRITQIRFQLDTLQPANNTITLTGSDECNLDITGIHPTHGSKVSHAFHAIPTRKDVFSTLLFSIDVAKSLTAPTTDADAGTTGTCAKLAPSISIEGAKVNGFDFAYQVATP